MSHLITKVFKTFVVDLLRIASVGSMCDRGELIPTGWALSVF